MNDEDLEFQISQYLDGTLAPSERQAIDVLLQTDPTAKKILADFQYLNLALSTHEWTPQLQWDQLTQHISNAIDQATAPTVAGRIGLFQQKWRIAAAVLIAGSAGLLAHHAMQSHRTQMPAQIPGSSVVVGPGAEVAQGAPVEDISVGPSPALAMHDADWRYGEGVVGRGSSNVVLLDALAAPDDTKSRAHQ